MVISYGLFDTTTGMWAANGCVLLRGRDKYLATEVPVFCGLVLRVLAIWFIRDRDLLLRSYLHVQYR